MRPLSILAVIEVVHFAEVSFATQETNNLHSCMMSSPGVSWQAISRRVLAFGLEETTSWSSII